MRSRFWIVIVLIFPLNLTSSGNVNAEGALADVQIFRGVITQRNFAPPGTTSRTYKWSFENVEYMALMAIYDRWYNKNRNDQRQQRQSTRSTLDNFLPMVNEGTEALQDLIREFKKVMPREWRDERKVNFVLAFVQSLPYTDDAETTGYGDFYKYVTETLVEGGGDCEDTSVLFASIMSGLDFKLALINPPGHLAVGVKGNFRGAYVSYENEKYFFCETTGIDWRLGQVPQRYENIGVKIIPITPKPVTPKEVKPQIAPPKLNPPKIPSYQKTLEKGINLAKDARHNEAIKTLRSCLRGLKKPEQRAKAYFYLGRAMWGLGAGKDETEDEQIVKKQFQEALRQNPDILETPWPDHPRFEGWFQEVREESIGKLTITASLPESLLPKIEIWIEGNEINRERLGIGTFSLFKGNYTVEVIYEDESKEKEVIKIKPNSPERFEVKMPPIVKHEPISEVSVHEAVYLTLDISSHKQPEKVQVYYTIYDKNNWEIQKNSKKMLFLKMKAASSTWVYHVTLPPLKHGGSIQYHIEVEYRDRDHPVVRHPKNQYHRIAVIDDGPPSDDEPPVIVLQDRVQTAKISRSIIIKAKVTDDTSVDSVYLMYGFSRFRDLEPRQYRRRILTKSRSGIYTGSIPSQSEPGYIWYYLIATDESGNQGLSPELSNKMKIKVVDDEPVDDEPPVIVLQDRVQTAKISRSIIIKAKVTDDTSVDSVYLMYGFSRFRDLEPRQYRRRILTKSRSGIYTGSIPSQSEPGYIWYYLIATDENGNQGGSPESPNKIKIQVSYPKLPPDIPDNETETSREPPPSESDSRMHKPTVRQGIWATLWGTFGGGSFNFDWSRGDVLSFAFLREGRTHYTFGTQFDFNFENELNGSAILEWGPALGKSPIALTGLGGLAGYNISDDSTYITPILGASVKCYPLDGFTVEAIGSLKPFPSVFDTTPIYRWEVGMRIYMHHLLNLKVGYGEWYVSNRSIKRVQIGLGRTF